MNAFFLIQKYFYFIFLIFIFAACGKKKNKVTAHTKPSGPPPASVVDMYVVRNIPVSDNIILPGTVIANESTEIHPEISGRLTQLNIAEGRQVAKGTLLAKIYDGDLRAQLSKLSVQLEQAQRTTKRYEELLKINGVSQQEYDMQVLGINNIKADMAVVRSEIQRTEIRAPFNGTLGLKNVSPGAYVTPATILTTIRQNSQLKLDYTLPEKYVTKVENGQIINFTIEGNPKNYTARVMATERGLNEENRSMGIRALIINNDGKILPGVFVKVSTNFDPDPNAIMIPSQAIIPQARGKKVAVYRNGIAEFDDIETGYRDSAKVQITSGLKVGDTVIVSGLMSLKPNAKVKVGNMLQ